jgi:hypothetical protein
MFSYLIVALIISVIWSLLAGETFFDFLQRFGFICLFNMLIYYIVH